MSDRRFDGPNRARRAAVVFAAVFAACLLIATAAAARPGGGGSFSSGGTSRGSSGGGSGFFGAILDLIFAAILDALFDFVGAYPKVAVPLIVMIFGAIYWGSRSDASKEPWSTAVRATGEDESRARSEIAAAESPLARSASIAALTAIDPDFSSAVFEDFLYALFAEGHGALSPSRRAELVAYFAPAARAALDALHGDARVVDQIIVGAMSLAPFALDGDRVRVHVAFESNYAETRPDGARSFVDREAWTLERKASARSRPPDRARIFACPSCGAPLSELRDSAKGSTCAHCGRVVSTGDFDWIVTQVVVAWREERAPILTSDTTADAERRARPETIFDPGCSPGLAALFASDRGVTADTLRARVTRIFDALQVAWSERDWLRARPFVSDAYFHAELPYVEAYRRAGLKNVTKDASIVDFVIVKVTRDRWYDAVTIRLDATSLDFTVDETDHVVSGSRTHPRRYSEYWTLLRGVGARGAAKSDRHCPNCGAILSVDMAGACTFCQARVASGEFDWVLSRIEQDASYVG